MCYTATKTDLIDFSVICQALQGWKEHHLFLKNKWQSVTTWKINTFTGNTNDMGKATLKWTHTYVLVVY